MKKLIAPVVMLCAVLISSTASAANWVWVYSDSRYTIYVDNNSIQRDRNYSGYVFRAFVKWIYSDAGRKNIIEDYRLEGRPLPRGIYNLSEAIYLKYYKIENGIKYTAVVSKVAYTHDGSTLPEMSGSSYFLIWDIVTPDSIGEAIFDNIRARVPN